MIRHIEEQCNCMPALFPTFMPVNESSEDYELHFETEEYYEICKFSEVGWKILIGWKHFLSMWDVRHRFTGILHIKIAIVIQAWFHKEIPVLHSYLGLELSVILWNLKRMLISDFRGWTYHVWEMETTTVCKIIFRKSQWWRNLTFETQILPSSRWDFRDRVFQNHLWLQKGKDENGNVDPASYPEEICASSFLITGP